MENPIVPQEQTMENFIEPYKTEWKTEFDKLKRVLLKTLNGYHIDIQHVGSTAIKGLFSKPILDIDIILHNYKDFDEIRFKLEKVGCKNRGEQGILGRFAFKQQTEFIPTTDNNYKWQEHHLYVCFSDSLALKNHLLFRNALLNDKSLVERYSQLKISLIQKKGMTREKYTQQKTDFIISVLATLGFDKKELNEITNANN